MSPSLTPAISLHHEVYVHIDKKSTWTPAQFKKELAKECSFSKVYIR
jgi:hypothetical protein